MYNKITKNIGLILGFIFLANLMGCKDTLNVQPYSQLSPSNYLSTKKGIKSVLTQAYAKMQKHGHNSTIQLHAPLVVTGMGYGARGAWLGSTLKPMEKWNWNSSMWFFNMYWNSMYDLIYNANTVLDNLDNSSFSKEFKNKMKGQALALRAYAYQKLYQWFGTVPIHTSTKNEELNKPRATEKEMKNRIENDYLNAAALLPVNQPHYRVTKGGALGMLARFCLNTMQWEKAAKYSKKVMDLGKYELFPDFTTLFHIQNEGNSEMIWVQPNKSAVPGQGTTLAGLTYPNDFPFKGSQGAWPARMYIYDWVVDLYPSGDARADSTVLLRSYINRSGKLIKGYPGDKTLPFKYGLDPEARGGGQAGYDMPELRYADILMMRAEALNEMQGPNQESINLINKVRERAGISDWNLADFGSKDELRDAIFEERQREFLFEPVTRIDQIRHGTFVSNAKDRGISKANEDYRLYPIPQPEMDANKKIKQNPGY